VTLKVLLSGYYGCGNLGDDILMMISFNLLRELLPDVRFSIFSNHSARAYIRNLMPGYVDMIDATQTAHFDVLFDGGGGIYFDFSNGGMRRYLLNRLIDLIGPRAYARLYRYLRKESMEDWKITYDARIGAGIGIGPFTKSGYRYAKSMYKLSLYDLLLVRDKMSSDTLTTMHFKGKSYVTTDLAFLTDYWPLPHLQKKKQSANSIAIILRDWPYDGHRHMAMMEETCRKLQRDGQKLSFFVFDPQSDKKYTEMFRSFGTMHVWDACQHSLSNFLSLIAVSDLVITSRAHGAILGACLGCPAICIEVEPKLKNVSLMLHRSSKLLKADAPPEVVIQNIGEIYENYSQRLRMLDEDVSENVEKAKWMIAIIRQSLHSLQRSSLTAHNVIGGI